MIKFFRIKLFIVAIFSLLLSEVTFAAAFQFYEVGAPINSTAGVGQAAVASDASTAYFNPAGMGIMPDSQLMLGTQAMLPFINFSPNKSTTIRGDNGGNAGSLIPGISAFFVYSFSPKLKFGFSMTTPYGGALNYNDHWVGRYSAQQLIFYALDLNPAIAYQVNPWISLGAGVTVEYANIYQTAALPILNLFDGQVTVKADNFSPGFNLGLLLTPTNTTKVGVAYRSQIIHNLRGNISLFNVAVTPGASTSITSPANIIASISQNVTNQVTLLGEVGWANWSTMVNNILTVRNLSAITVQNWHDTYRVGLGGQYRMIPSLLLEAGVSYDSSPTSASRRLPNLPMDGQIRVGTGVEYAIMNAVKFALSYEYLNFGKARINNISSNGVLAGSYSRNYANVLQLSLNVDC